MKENLCQLQTELVNHTYQTSNYQTFVKHEPKERIISKLPFRDRVIHWALMLILEPIWVNSFTRDTYACIQGRGIHACKDKLEKDLRNDPDGTRYCLQLDIRKFYPSIDHDILKSVIRRKLKDPEMLQLLDGIIDSAEGVPIGNYISQYLANLYLAELDHQLKEVAGVKYYYRYADDLVLLSNDKEQLRAWLLFINHYLHEQRKLDIKPNWQIYPVDEGSRNPRGIDFVGYRFFHTHTLLRKSIKQNMCRKLSKLNRRKRLTEEEKKQALCSHFGWAKHCNSTNLLNKLGMSEIKKFSREKYPRKEPEVPKKKFMDGDKILISEVFGKTIIILDWALEPSIYEGDRIKLQYEIKEQPPGENGKRPRYISFFYSENVHEQLNTIRESEENPFPMEVKFTTQDIMKGGTKKGSQYFLDEPDD